MINFAIDIFYYKRTKNLSRLPPESEIKEIKDGIKKMSMNSLLLRLKTAYLKAMRLRPLLEQMGEFSTRYCASDVFKDKKPRAFRDVLESQVQSR